MAIQQQATIRKVGYTPNGGQLLGNNPLRSGLILHNNSDQPVLIALSPEPASKDNYTYRVYADSHLELLYIPLPETMYRGIITFAWETAPSAGGYLMVTEFTIKQTE